MSTGSIHIYRMLQPLAWLYGLGVSLRGWLFDTGLLRSRSFPLPVICVGNLAVGGTGKTPHTEYLIRLLADSFQVATLSRGYKRRSRGFRLAALDTPVSEIGDEPYQMKHKFPRVHVAVDEKRVHGIDCLLAAPETCQTDVILLDDAYQHRYVKPGLNILLTDYHRLFPYDCLLPAGRLRESAAGKRRADIVVVTKCPAGLRPMDYRVVRKTLDLMPCQRLYFTTLVYGSLYPLFSDEAERPLTSLQSGTHALVVTGIANPGQMLRDLQQYPLQLETLTFADHHNFTASDARCITERFAQIQAEDRLLITTEKDASRLRNLPGLSSEVRQRMYVLPLAIRFLCGETESFNTNILNYVRKNSRNS